jgi:hypothetical protein
MLRPWLLGALALVLLAVAAMPAVGSEAAPSSQAARRTRTATPLRTATPRPTGTAPATPVNQTSARQRQFVPMLGRDATPTPTPIPTPAPRTQMAVGTNVIDNNFELHRDMGFTWVKLYAEWDGADPEAQVNGALQRYPTAKILLRIDRSPASARTYVDDDPIRADQLQSYLRNLVPRLKGKVQAYELFNEPNLKWEWQEHIAGTTNMPSALGYARILRAAYPAIKEIDPSAVVVTGGVSPAGNGGSGAVGDLDFIQGLYDHAPGSFDAIGIHPYGGPHAWNQGKGDPNGVYFLRAEESYEVAVRNGDPGRKLWATELGWLVDPRVYGYGTYAGRDCTAGLGGRIGWVRGPQDVADQLVAAHRHAADNWPWMAGMFMFNFDFSAAGWVNHYDKVCDAPTWYSIVSKNNMPGRPYTEPAYDALRVFSRGYLGAG